eukprot:8811447-Alexandrium_andersonii.AAC.1
MKDLASTGGGLAQPPSRPQRLRKKLRGRMARLCLGRPLRCDLPRDRSAVASAWPNRAGLGLGIGSRPEHGLG